MSSKEKVAANKRKQMLKGKLIAIAAESEYVKDLISDIQCQALSLVSKLEADMDKLTFLRKFSPVFKMLEHLQTDIRSISYDLDTLAYDDNQRTPEDSNLTSAIPENEKKEKAEKVPDSEKINLSTIPCSLKENDILDMRYVSGESPHDFWLRFYSVKQVDKIRCNIKKLYEQNKLRRLKCSELVGAIVCVCDGDDCFRGSVIKQLTVSPPSYIVRNIDSGHNMNVKKDNIYRPTQKLYKIQAQVINCCLVGILGDPLLWNADLTQLFRHVMKNSSSVVTICSRPTNSCAKFMVKVDVYNEMWKESHIDLSSWVTCKVLPVLMRKEQTISGNALKPLFDSLSISSEDESESSTDDAQETRLCMNHTLIRSVHKEVPSTRSDCHVSLNNYETAGLATSVDEAESASEKAVLKDKFGHTNGAIPMKELVAKSESRSRNGTNQIERISLRHHHKEVPSTRSDCHVSLNNYETAGLATSVDEAESASEKAVLKDKFGHTNGAIPMKELVAKSESRSGNGTNQIERISLRHHQFNLMLGARYEAFVTHIIDPDKFYIHLFCKDNALIETLDQEMTKNYITCFVKFKSKEQAKKILFESWCAVFFEDEHGQMWHRGRVIDWMDNTDKSLIVQYVDYGEVRQVTLDLIKPLKAQYTKLPICATLCKLALIRPPKLQSKSAGSIWSAEAIELFRILVNPCRIHTIVVIDPSPNSLKVLLVNDDGTVINQTMVDLQHADECKPIEFDPSLPIQRVKEDMALQEGIGIKMSHISSVEKEEKVNCAPALMNENVKDSTKRSGNCMLVKEEIPFTSVNGACSELLLESWDPMLEDYDTSINNGNHTNEDACYAVMGYSPRDEARLCKFFAEKGYCFKGITCTKEHRLPNPDGWTTDQEAVVQEPLSVLILPPAGTMVTVIVTSIYKPNLFYALIDWENKSTSIDDENLMTLNRFINAKENVEKMKLLQNMPAVGELVLAKYYEDDNFFRAKVVDTHFEQQSVQVMYTDYGNTEWIRRKDIRQMELRYLHFPFQAVECCFGNLKIVKDDVEALNYVSSLILGKQLSGIILSSNILAQVQLNLWGDDNKEIADKLVQKGYAEYSDSGHILAEDARIIPG